MTFDFDKSHATAKEHALWLSGQQQTANWTLINLQSIVSIVLLRRLNIVFGLQQYEFDAS